MYVIHTMLIRAGSGIPTTYAAQVVACRWTNKNKGKWTGRAMRDTGDYLTLPEGVPVHAVEVRAQCDALSDAVAKRMNMKSGPDFFPFT